MIICICNNISDSDLTLEELYARVKEKPQCGNCIKYMRRELGEHLSSSCNRTKDQGSTEESVSSEHGR